MKKKKIYDSTCYLYNRRMMKTEGTGRNEVKGQEILLNLSHVTPMEAAF